MKKTFTTIGFLLFNTFISAADVPDLSSLPKPALNEAFFEAASHNDIPAATTLLNAGADINYRHQYEVKGEYVMDSYESWAYEETALIHAARHGHAGMVTSLLTRNHLPFLNTLIAANELAPRQDFPPEIATLVLRPLTCTYPLDLDRVNRDRQTALACAIGSKKWSIARELYKAGAKLYNDKSPEKNQLICALIKKNGAAARFLIEMGADVNARSIDGKSPLHVAVNQKDYESIQDLIEYRADPNTRDNKGRTPLFYAAARGDTVSGQLLFDHGAIVDVQLDTGDTPLMFAAAYGKTSFVKFLLKRGADKTIKDKRDCLALDYAHESRVADDDEKREVSELLKQE